jgi:tetratricopeptide (TPR) repeat protein
MNKNIVFCDGGISNRLNTLIFALILKQKFDYKWEISWPENNWCNASFESLFDIDITSANNSLSYYKKNQYFYNLLMHENQMNFDEAIINYNKNIRDYQDINYYFQLGKPVFYYNNIIPNFVSLDEIISGVSDLKIQSSIFNVAIEYCENNKIDETVLGLHIRKTDFGNLIDDNELFLQVRNSDKQFFVCSDDKNVMLRFSELKNCKVFQKNHYPTLLDPNKNWQDNIIDDQNRVFSFNIFRSSESIKEALIDLLILSKTTLIHTSNSTFLNMSKIFKMANILSNKE